MRIILLLSFVLLISGCTDILDQTYCEATLDRDLLEIKSGYDSLDTTVLMRTILRYKLQRRQLHRLTYRELLEDGKRYQESRQEQFTGAGNSLFDKAKRE